MSDSALAGTSIEVQLERLDPGYKAPYVPFVQVISEPSEVFVENPVALQLPPSRWAALGSPETVTVVVSGTESEEQR